MVNLSEIDAIFQAAERSGNEVMTVELFPDNGIAVTLRAGLEAAYEHGDPIFTNDRNPVIIGDINAQKLEQAYNNSPVGAENNDVQKLEQLDVNAPNADANTAIKIGADAAYKTTDIVDDIADVNIHLEHKVGHKEKIAGGVEVATTPAEIVDIIKNLENPYQDPALNAPVKVNDLHMLHPSNTPIIAETQVSDLPIMEFVTNDAIVTVTNDEPRIVQIQYNDKVDIGKLQTQLEALAQDKHFGQNSDELLQVAMQEIRNQKLHSENASAIINPSSMVDGQAQTNSLEEPITQINTAIYNGVAKSQQVDVSAAHNR